MEQGKNERLVLPDVDQLQRMLRLANDLHAMPSADRVRAALEGLADLVQADAAAAWSGPATALAPVGIAARPVDPIAKSDMPPQHKLLPAGVGLLIGRRQTLSPVVRLHSDPATQTHEIRSVCGGDAGPSLLVVRRSKRPFDQRQRTIVHLLHPQTEWLLRLPPAPAELSQKHKVVLELLLSGHSEKQLAERLADSPHTVHSRIKHIYRHFGVASRAQLLAKFVVKPERTGRN